MHASAGRHLAHRMSAPKRTFHDVRLATPSRHSGHRTRLIRGASVCDYGAGTDTALTSPFSLDEAQNSGSWSTTASSVGLTIARKVSTVPVWTSLVSGITVVCTGLNLGVSHGTSPP